MNDRARQGAADAFDALDDTNDALGEIVEGVGLGFDDDVVGAHDLFCGENPGNLGDLFHDRRRATDIGLDQDVGRNGHGGLPAGDESTVRNDTGDVVGTEGKL